MPGKKKSKGKSKSRGTYTEKRAVKLKGEEEEYALVEKILGDRRTELACADGEKRMGLIRGKFRKRVWINRYDVVLISLRDFQEEKADIIHKYKPEEVRELQRKGEVPPDFLSKEKDEDEENEFDDFLMDEEGEKEEVKGEYDPYAGIDDSISSSSSEEGED